MVNGVKLNGCETSIPVSIWYGPSSKKMTPYRVRKMSDIEQIWVEIRSVKQVELEQQLVHGLVLSRLEHFWVSLVDRFSRKPFVGTSL